MRKQKQRNSSLIKIRQNIKIQIITLNQHNSLCGEIIPSHSCLCHCLLLFRCFFFLQLLEFLLLHYMRKIVYMQNLQFTIYRGKISFFFITYATGIILPIHSHPPKFIVQCTQFSLKTNRRKFGP